MKFFNHDGSCCSYTDLIQRLNNINSSSNIVLFNEPLKFFTQLLFNICNNIDSILFDNDMSESEKEFYEKDLILYDNLYSNKINDINDLLNLIYNSKSRICIFTSGTTGKPKKVNHSVSKFVEMSRVDDKYKNDIWSFLYNPTHMAGIQVFFQALLNQNFIIFLFKSTRKQFINSCNKYSVTSISATPTFFRLLAPFDFKLKSIKKCTLGGEKSDLNLNNNLKNIFPCTKLYNIYASTEAGTVFISTKGNLFKVMNSTIDKVKFIDNEIFLHKTLMYENYKEEWFPTGDIVEFTNESKTEFRFLSRNSDTVNIGGNRINLLEIESEIYKIKGVENVLVYTLENSVIGKVLVSKIVTSIKYSKKEFKLQLKEKLQSYKVPAIIKFVNEIEVTRTGKIKRN